MYVDLLSFVEVMQDVREGVFFDLVASLRKISSIEQIRL